MAKRKRRQTKKSKPTKLQYREILIGAIVDLLVGILLIIIDRMTD